MNSVRELEIQLDVVDLKKNDFPLGVVKQLDSTTIRIYLYNDGRPMCLEGASATIYAVKPSSKVVYQTSDIKIDEYFEYVEIKCKNSIFEEVGIVKLECEIYDENKDKITSPNFLIEVMPRLNCLDPDNMAPAQDIDFLTEFLEYMKNSKAMVEEFRELLQELGVDGVDAVQNFVVIKEMAKTAIGELDEELSEHKNKCEKIANEVLIEWEDRLKEYFKID